MNTGNLLVGAGLGAALAYMLDPDTGNRRRALLRDQLVRAGRKTRGGLDATARDVVNRGRGVAAVTRARLRPEHVDDDTLRERVRAKLGHVSAHPRAIDVHVQNGNVTLRGPILASEITDVLTTVSNVRGVRAVTNELDSHESSDNVPSLQGEGKGATPRFRPSPATRALVAAGVATGVWMYAKR